MNSRIKRHNSGYELSTKRGVPWILIWSTQKESKGWAMMLKRKLKNLHLFAYIDNGSNLTTMRISALSIHILLLANALSTHEFNRLLNRGKKPIGK